jgi:hypothetical protein
MFLGIGIGGKHIGSTTYPKLIMYCHQTSSNGYTTNTGRLGGGVKVGLIDVDSKMPNLALMKLKSYYQQAELAYPINYNKFDMLYASSIFDFSDKSWISKEAIKGGAGYYIDRKLPKDIEFQQPDYSLYPESKVSMQRYSIGCIRKCSFCVVPKSEGKIKPYDPMNLNPSGEWIYLLDNNFFATPNWKESINHLIGCNQPVQFEGVDIRILTEEMEDYLYKVRLKGQIHIAWDNPKDKLLTRIQKIKKPYKFMCYVLIGYNSTPEEDMERVLDLDGNGIDPFVMPYDKSNNYQRHFARWVNHKAIFNSCNFKEYLGNP